MKTLREVILSAGAIASPKVLMLSGVGPESHLRQHRVSSLQLFSGLSNSKVIWVILWSIRKLFISGFRIGIAKYNKTSYEICSPCKCSFRYECALKHTKCTSCCGLHSNLMKKRRMGMITIVCACSGTCTGRLTRCGTESARPHPSTWSPVDGPQRYPGHSWPHH